MSQALPRSTPSAEGVAGDSLAAFIDAVARVGVELHSLMVLRHGRVIAEGWWEPYRPDDAQLLYSLSKSFNSTALGFAVAEGLVDLDAPLASYFPQFAADVQDPRTAAMRVRDAAMMASGHRQETIDEARTEDCADLVQGFLRIPPEEQPGSWFTYNQPPSYAIGAVVQDRTGETLSEYLRPRLFEPLGIERFPWDHLEGDRREAGFVGLHLTTESIAKFGQLLLQDGHWDGRPLLPAGWVAQATATQIATDRQAEPDWAQGYGFQFWRARHGFRGDGAFGQFCIVLPDQEVVVAITGATDKMQVVLTALWDHFLPGVDGPTDSSQDRRLADRLRALRLDTATGALAAAAAPFELAEPQALAAGGWRLPIRADGLVLDLEAGDGAWTRNVVDLGDGTRIVAEARAGWRRPGLFTADLVFVETPHRAVVRWYADTARSYARWHTAPLPVMSPLRQLTTPWPGR